MSEINGMFVGNLLELAAILFTGATYNQFKEISDCIGLIWQNFL